MHYEIIKKVKSGKFFIRKIDSVMVDSLSGFHFGYGSNTIKLEDRDTFEECKHDLDRLLEYFKLREEDLKEEIVYSTAINKNCLCDG